MYVRVNSISYKHPLCAQQSITLWCLSRIIHYIISPTEHTKYFAWQLHLNPLRTKKRRILQSSIWMLFSLHRVKSYSRGHGIRQSAISLLDTMSDKYSCFVRVCIARYIKLSYNVLRECCCCALITSTFSYWICHKTIKMIFTPWNTHTVLCWFVVLWLCYQLLTHWGWYKMTVSLHKIFLISFSSMKMFVLWFKFHWNMFVRVQLTVRPYWLK